MKYEGLSEYAREHTLIEKKFRQSLDRLLGM